MSRKPSPYERKFATFIHLLATTKLSGAEAVLIHHPEVLGDNYSELVESLNRLAQAELTLRIVPPSARARPDR